MPIRQAARDHMIDGQLAPGHIVDNAIIHAMGEVPRETFLPEKFQGTAYLDEEIEVGKSRYLMAPLAFGRLIELAGITNADKVLDVGCLTGYSTAILAKLAGKVIGVEEQRELAEKARQNLKKLGISNAEIVTAPLTAGHAVAGPYDVIIIEGAVGRLPEQFFGLLAEKGRLAVVENVASRPGFPGGLGKAVLYRKLAGTIGGKYVAFDASVPLLPGFERPNHFVF